MMAGPWEKYQKKADGPWSKYQEPEAAPSGIYDVLASGVSGVARGAADLAGLPGSIADALNSGGRWALREGYEAATGKAPSSQGGAFERFFAGPSEEVSNLILGGSPFSGARARSGLSAVTGGASEYEPQTTAGEFAGTVGEFIPGAAAFGGLSPSNLMTYGVIPGLANEAAGQVTEGSAVEPYARIAASLVAPMLASRMITPIGASADRLAARDALRAEGVNPTAGQVTGNRNLRAMESELGGSKTAQIVDDQLSAFTDAAMRRAGGSGLATPENMTRINDRLSQGFTDIAARNTLRFDPAVGQGIGQTLNRYERVLPTEQRAIVQNLADDIIERFRVGNGSMSGSDYQTIRSRLTKAAHAARNSDTEYADALRGLRNTLDDGMARSVSPDDAAEWTRLRREYGNMKVLEKAAAGAGEDAALGNISPARLRQAATSGRRGEYSRGEGDFDVLARSGEALLKPLPDSGTATRLNARALGNLLGAGGAGTGAIAAGAPGAIIGALLGGAAPMVAGRAMMMRPVQAWLANTLTNPASLRDPGYAAVIEALLSQRLSAPQQ